MPLNDNEIWAQLHVPLHEVWTKVEQLYVKNFSSWNIKSWQQLPKCCFAKIYIGMYVHTYNCIHICAYTQNPPTHTQIPFNCSWVSLHKTRSIFFRINFKNLSILHKSWSCCKCRFFFSCLTISDRYFPPLQVWYGDRQGNPVSRGTQIK